MRRNGEPSSRPATLLASVSRSVSSTPSSSTYWAILTGTCGSTCCTYQIPSCAGVRGNRPPVADSPRSVPFPPLSSRSNRNLASGTHSRAPPTLPGSHAYRYYHGCRGSGPSSRIDQAKMSIGLICLCGHRRYRQRPHDNRADVARSCGPTGLPADHRSNLPPHCRVTNRPAKRDETAAHNPSRRSRAGSPGGWSRSAASDAKPPGTQLPVCARSRPGSYRCDCTQFASGVRARPTQITAACRNPAAST